MMSYFSDCTVRGLLPNNDVSLGACCHYNVYISYLEWFLVLLKLKE